MTVDPIGDIYTCQNIPNYSETKIGTVKTNFTKLNSSEFIAPEVGSIDRCNECWIKYLCAGGCFYEKFVDNNDVYKPSLNKCEVLKLQWENHLRLYQKLKKNNIKFIYEKNKQITV